MDGLLLELRRRRRGDEEDFNVLGGMRPGMYEEKDGAEDFPVWGDMTSGMYEEDLRMGIARAMRSIMFYIAVRRGKQAHWRFRRGSGESVTMPFPAVQD